MNKSLLDWITHCQCLAMVYITFHGIIRYSFPCKDNLEPLDSFKDEFLHLGGLLGEGFDLGSASKKRVDFG